MICLPEVSYPNTYLSKITTKHSKISHQKTYTMARYKQLIPVKTVFWGNTIFEGSRKYSSLLPTKQHEQEFPCKVIFPLWIANEVGLFTIFIFSLHIYFLGEQTFQVNKKCGQETQISSGQETQISSGQGTQISIFDHFLK